jgi:hypothetical protein
MKHCFNQENLQKNFHAPFSSSREVAAYTFPIIGDFPPSQTISWAPMMPPPVPKGHPVPNPFLYAINRAYATYLFGGFITPPKIPPGAKSITVVAPESFRPPWGYLN